MRAMIALPSVALPTAAVPMTALPRTALPLIALVLVSCGPLPDSRPSDADLVPPQLQTVEAGAAGEVTVTFDEEAVLNPGKTRITPVLALGAVDCSGPRIVIRAEGQVPGVRYTLEGEAQDRHGNTCSFAAEFYGYNGRVPPILVNELTPRGSGSHPDLVELKCLNDGNIGGAVLYLGSPGSHDARYVFPPLEVAAGAFIVLHLKPEGDPSERDETTDPAESGGFDASPAAWDFWMRESPGLPGNNGALTVCDRPGGRCLDAVLWSNRTAESDEEYGGFGSEQMRTRAEELASLGAWVPAGTRLTPEDAVSPEGTTGTRSLCRGSDSVDTNGRDDWHIVPTRKSSFGRDNSDERYEAPAAALP